MAASTSTSTFPGMRERRPSTSAPISELQGPVGPGFSRPKHKRTFTGFGAGEIKNVEGEFCYSFSLFCQQIISPHFGGQGSFAWDRHVLLPLSTPRRASWNNFRACGKSAFWLMCTVLMISCKQLPSPNPSVKLGRSSHHTASRTRRTSRKK